MKKKNNFQLTKKVIPGGEGFNALPTAFVAHPSLPKCVAIATIWGGCPAQGQEGLETIIER